MNKISLAAFMAAVLGLSACAAFDAEPYKLQRNVSTITVESDPMLLVRDGKNGVAYVNGSTCKVVLNEYPKCLAHEVRHCYEGAWHPTSSSFPPNSDDCDQGWGQEANTK